MFGLSPLMQRSALAKTLGFAVGLVGFFVVRGTVPDADPLLAWGFLALYMTIGGVVGIMGTIDRIPLFDIPLPPALRGGIMGGWFALLVLLFAFDALSEAIAQMTYLPAFLRSVWWMLAEAAVIGGVIDIIVSRIIGNGEAQLLPTV